ncbi:MAG TPA: SDR family oxidoreductase [Nitrospira sp.]|nr:SDR family oxidoreductase [Nitrospira sp.]
MNIVVVGGRGVVGTKLVPKLNEQGHHAISASRATGMDAFTGEGVAAVLTDAHVVVDVTNPPSFEAATAINFFETTTRNLLSAELEAGIHHHIMLSVVGADRMTDNGYMRAKVAQEQLIQAGRVPYTILRATQFFEFINTIIDVSTINQTVRLAPVLFQPIAVDDVIAALADIVVSMPANGIVNLAGPEVFRLPDVAQRLFTITQRSCRMVMDSEAPYFGGRLNEQSLVPIGEHHAGATRFEDWLNSQP